MIHRTLEQILRPKSNAAGNGDAPVDWLGMDQVLDAEGVDEEEVLREVAGQLGLDYVAEPETDGGRALTRAVSAGIALRHRVLPLSIDIPNEDDEGGDGVVRLRMATYDPLNLAARQTIARIHDGPVEWVVTSRKKLISLLQALYGVGADTFEEILAGREVDESSLDMKDEASVLDDVDDEASVVKFVNQIIREALEQRATDIHVEPLRDNLRIRYRIDGRLHEVAVPERIKALQSAVLARLKIMARLDIAERRLPQDGRINLELGGRNIDVRVATIPTVEGESMSLRLLNQEKFSIESLRLEPYIDSSVRRLLRMSNGIVLVTGPTGSGKSTTLYTFLSELNLPDRRIVTIEDPVENKLDGVMQIAVRPEIKLTFASGLRSILRGDPNIVMVGEIRDLETAEIAIRASLTGHLVFSTLHTNDAIGGITRLTDMGLEPFLIASSVRAFIAQRLVRRLCPDCKALRDDVSQDMLIGTDLILPSDATLYKAVGCASCRNTGYRGRLAIFEVCMLTRSLQEMIVQKQSYSQLLTEARREGFQSLRDYGWRKAMQGETTLEEVISVTSTEVEGE